MSNFETPKNNERRESEAIFLSSTKTRRSPAQRAASSAGIAEDNLNTPQDRNTTTVSMPVQPSVTYSSPRLEYIMKMRMSEEEAFANCQKVLRKIRLAMNKQRNISMDVQNGVSELGELMDVIGNYRRNWKNAEGEREKNRPQLTQDETDSRINVNGSNAMHLPLFQNKRNASSPAEPNPGKKQKKAVDNKSKKDLPEKEENWTMVTKRNRERKTETNLTESENKPKPRPQRPKTEAVIIKPVGNYSYSEVLKNLRSKIKTDETVKIRSVRKTQTGAILLELGRGQQVKPEFIQQLKSTVKDAASVAELRPKATIEIRHLDFVTQKDEVEIAIRELLANTDEQIQTKLTLPNAREQIRAFLTMSAESAAKLIEIGYVKIGWIRARMRACEDIRRCYRCLETGHLQANCSGLDRRAKCIRCGESGHKMKECNAAPKCIHCVDAKRDQTDHFAGSKRCPQVKKC